MNKTETKIEKNNYEPSVAQDVTPENKKNSKTKKIIAIVISIIVVICLAVGIWFAIEKSANKWEVKQNEITLEYGEVYEPVLSDLVDFSAYPNVNDVNTEIKVIATRDGENEYISVGEHEINIIHQIEYKLFGMTLFKSNDTKAVKLIVNDTIAPVFAEDVPTELETYKDCEIENLEEKFSATDKATVSITIDKENIDYATVGEYTANVYATDASGNVSNKEIIIKVLEPTVEIDKTSLNMKVGTNDTITATVKGKDQNVEWISSDASVATVENGTVKAVKEGTTTITAKANGVEATCETTVKAKSVASTSNSNGKNNNSSKPSSSGGSSSSSNSGNSNGNSGNSSTTTTTAPYYCDEGGDNHRRNVGQIGWYDTPNEAQNAVSQYLTKADTSGGFTIVKCNCGKYTAYITTR